MRLLPTLAAFWLLVLLFPPILAVFTVSYCEVKQHIEYVRVSFCEVLQVPVVLGVFYSHTAVFRGSMLLTLRALAVPQDVCTVGTAYTRSFGTAHNPSTRSISATRSTAHTPGTRSTSASTGNTHSTRISIGVRYCGYSQYFTYFAVRYQLCCGYFQALEKYLGVIALLIH